MLGFAAPLPLLASHSQGVSRAVSRTTPKRAAPCTKTAPTMGPWKKGEKDEAFRQQQEILARRRNKQKNKEHFEEIERRRKEIEAYYDERRLKVPLGEDPLVAWQKLKDAGLLGDSATQYDTEDEGGIIIPMASFGIPKYDNGGRFDLRLPHVEVGYTDPDADVMSKAGNALKNMFGFGKKEEAKGDDESAEEKRP